MPRSTPGFTSIAWPARIIFAEALRTPTRVVSDCATIDAILRDAGGFAAVFASGWMIGHDVTSAVTRSVWVPSGSDPASPLADPAGVGRRRLLRQEDRARLLRLP